MSKKGVTSPFKPPTKQESQEKASTTKLWATDTKDADIERILERLDRIIKDAEQVMDAIVDRLGLDIDDGGDTEEYSTDEEDGVVRD